jgi:hypothetical protein
MISHVLERALISGTLAAAAVTLVASFAARRATGSSAAALNATSHFLWGERAGRQNAYSVKYTGTGFLANYGASIFWAVFYEALAGGKRRTAVRALRDGALISAAAYVTDYHVVPKRLTPGFEMRVPRAALVCVYAALAFGLSAWDLVKARSLLRGEEAGAEVTDPSIAQSESSATRERDKESLAQDDPDQE